jgi:hypothetical protein
VKYLLDIFGQLISRSYSTLLDATRRYSTLLDATRRYSTLLDVFWVCLRYIFNLADQSELKGIPTNVEFLREK